MAVINIKFRPTPKDLKWFGNIVLAFFFIIGILAFSVWGSSKAAIISIVLGIVLCAVYYLIRPLRHPMYVGWMRLVYPIGWFISHTLLGIIYYGLITPIGLTFRLVRRDALSKRVDFEASTYWQARKPSVDHTRYFKQS